MVMVRERTDRPFLEICIWEECIEEEEFALIPSWKRKLIFGQEKKILYHTTNMFRKKCQLKERLLSSHSLMFVPNPDHLQRLEAMFPSKSVQDLSNVLQQCHNDIDEAVDRLLRMAQEEDDRIIAMQLVGQSSFV